MSLETAQRVAEWFERYWNDGNATDYTSELLGTTGWPRSPKNSRKVRIVSVTFMA